MTVSIPETPHPNTSLRGAFQFIELEITVRQSNLFYFSLFFPDPKERDGKDYKLWQDLDALLFLKKIQIIFIFDSYKLNNTCASRQVSFIMADTGLNYIRGLENPD